MRWQAALFWGALSVTVLCEPAMALRNSARGTIAIFDDTEIVVTFGDRDQNRTDRCDVRFLPVALGRALARV